MEEPRLLAVFAHPDDESFGTGGTLARYSREGVEVHVCTVTDGAAGSYSVDEPAPGKTLSLADLRRQELACACQVLGAELHTLNYRDSGMPGTPENQHPNSLFQADLDDVATDLLRVIGQVRPHVILTHDPSGGYSHPDHIKVNQAMCRAWDRLAEIGWRPLRLYYAVIPRSSLRWFMLIMRLFRRDIRRFGQNRDVDLSDIGVPDEQIHVRLDVGAFLAIKERASACHKSQGGAGAPRLLPRFIRRRVLRCEYFVQAQPPGAPVHHDLWEGLELPARRAS